MLHTLTPWVLWQYIQTGFSFIMLKMKKNRRRRVYFNYDYLANASRKISMCGLYCQRNTKKSIIGAWITLIRHPHRSLNVCNFLVGDIGLAICQCQYIPKGEVWCIFWTIILKYEFIQQILSCMQNNRVFSEVEYMKIYWVVTVCKANNIVYLLWIRYCAKWYRKQGIQNRKG